jgi:excisionase family DNA binding protein
MVSRLFRWHREGPGKDCAVTQSHMRMASSVEKRRRSATSVLRPNISSSITAPMMLTAPEVCEYLRVSRTTLYRLFRDGDIRAFRVSKRDWRVAVDDLARWVERESRVWRFTRKV